mgnify:CR=1 FL=1
MRTPNRNDKTPPPQRRTTKPPFKIGDKVTVQGWQKDDKPFAATVTDVSDKVEQVLVHPEGRHFEVWVSEARVSR